MTTSLTQQFAAEYAKRAVPGMLRAIRLIKLANKGILLGAVAASYLHQAHYLTTLGAGIFAWILPAVFDLGIVSMLTITQTVGMADDAKRAALKVLIVVVAISAAVNYAAPGPLGLRIIFALVVGLVAGVEWVAGKIRPDFTAIEHREAEIASPIVDHAPVVAQVVDEQPTAAALPAPAVEPPAHLLTVARFAVVNHEQTTGHPITAAELAARMSITPAVAGQLIASITGHPAPINGATVVFGGVR